jgi:hypothetical protein
MGAIGTSGRVAFLVSSTLFFSACTTPTRVSTAELLSANESEVTLNKTYFETSAILKSLMSKRGLAMKNIAPTKDSLAQYFIFSGQRKTAASTANRPSLSQKTGQETGQKTGQKISQKTKKPVITVGSWIAARLEGKGKSTHVRFLGKPNIGDQELCSDADSQLEDAEYWCQNTYIKKDSPHLSQMSGREEAQLIRSLVSELKPSALR